MDILVPGLLIIDTPGHESFHNLRSRGSSLCDIAILVVDIMHGLEPQTIESINLLKKSKTPFIIALNKVDRLTEWRPTKDAAIQNTLKKQKPRTMQHFEELWKDVSFQLMSHGLNTALYWENKDQRTYVNVVPTSAHTGEGIPDLLYLLVHLTQKRLADKLAFSPELQCTVLEVKEVKGYGMTIDVILINGELKENDTLVLAGLEGPIVTQARSLLMPEPLKELRVKNSYNIHKTIVAAQVRDLGVGWGCTCMYLCVYACLCACLCVLMCLCVCLLVNRGWGGVKNAQIGPWPQPNGPGCGRRYIRQRLRPHRKPFACVPQLLTVGCPCPVTRTGRQNRCQGAGQGGGGIASVCRPVAR